MNKLLQHLIDAGDVSHRVLPGLPKAQVGKEIKLAPVPYQERYMRMPVDNTFVAPPVVGALKIPTTDVERYAARKARETPAQIVPANKPRSAAAQAWVENAYPMTALRYRMKGQQIPNNFEKGEINPFDEALAVINPFRWAHDFSNTGDDLVQGNYTKAAFDAASVLPFLAEAKMVAPGLQLLGQDARTALKYVPNGEDILKASKNAIEASKESGLLSNTYKINPFRFRPKGEAYKGLDNRGYAYTITDDRVFDNNSDHELYRINKNELFEEPKFYKYSDIQGRPDYLMEQLYLSHPDARARWERLGRSDIDPNAPYYVPQAGGNGFRFYIPNTNFYKKDWLQGYKMLNPYNVDLSVEPILNRIKKFPQTTIGTLDQLNKLKNNLAYKLGINNLKSPSGSLTKEEQDILDTIRKVGSTSKEGDYTSDPNLISRILQQSSSLDNTTLENLIGVTRETLWRKYNQLMNSNTNQIKGYDPNIAGQSVQRLNSIAPGYDNSQLSEFLQRIDQLKPVVSQNETSNSLAARLNEKFNPYLKETPFPKSYEELIHYMAKDRYNNPAKEVLKAYKKVQNASKGERFVPASSLSTDSEKMSLSLIEKALKENLIDLDYHGLNRMNRMGFITESGIDNNYPLREFNTILERINQNRPYGNKIPYSRLDNGDIYYPNLSVIRKKFGGPLYEFYIPQ